MSTTTTTATTLKMNLSMYTTSTSSSSNLSRRSIIFHSRNPNPKSSFQIRISNSSDLDGWFREEQRWLREEERWLRQEKRWVAERESLLRQISDLKNRLLHHRENSILWNQEKQQEQVDVARIAETSSSASPMQKLLETTATTPDVRVMKKGFQGADVRVMQDALLKLGFYSGEEDIEYSTFSTGTERAVKTWQASLDLPEDGVMTVHLLQILYAHQPLDKGGAADASITEKSQVQHRTVKGKPIPEVDVTKPRVFLLGENRWEEPSRLIGRDTPGGPSKTTNHTPKCPACQGQGRILCMECDGTGEPNIEEQFMEWVDEGAKCPYCDGLGEVTCDLCGVKTTI